jgi:HlyD family secretion protein
MTRSWVVSGAVAVIAFACGAYFRTALTQASNLKSNIRVVDARRGSIAEVISASGAVSGNGDVVVNCLASGEVTSMPFVIGDLVKKGQIVCRLDPGEEQKAVDEAKSALSRAARKLEQTQASAKLAEAELDISIQQAEENISSLRVRATNLQNKADRQKELLSKTLTSQEEFETAQTDAMQAATEFRNAILAKEEIKDRSDILKTEKAMDIQTVEDCVRNDERAVKEADDRLASTSIAAPMDGVVSDLKVSPSTWITQGGGEHDRKPIITVSDLSRIFVNVSVGTREIGLVHVGQKAMVSTDSYPGRTFTASVIGVSPTGSGVGDAVTFGVKIEVIGNDKSLLKPPMSAVARIIKEAKSDVLLVPNRAVMRKGTGAFVTIVGSDGRQQDRAVRIGCCDGSNDEITGGLSAGERVVIRTPNAGTEVAQSMCE